MAGGTPSNQRHARNQPKFANVSRPLFYLPKPLIGPDRLPDDVITSFDVQKDGTVRWFATPPLDVVTPFKIKHSEAYLEYKKSHPTPSTPEKSPKRNARKETFAKTNGTGNRDDLVNALKAWADATRQDSVSLANKI